MSPDGEMYWAGQEWVPLPSQTPTTTFQDTVVMGDVKTEIIHQHSHSSTINNTVVQDSEKMIRSHLNTMIDALSEGRTQDAKDIFERAKQIDYELANHLHNGEYMPALVNGFFRHVEHYCLTHVINYRFDRRRESINIYSQNLNNFYNIGIQKIQGVLRWNPNYTPCLMLNVEMIKKSNLSNKQKLIQIAKIYQYILSFEPQNEMLQIELGRILHKQKINMLLVVIPVGAFCIWFLAALIF
ncbi:MAG: hypothetical protein HOL22_01565 [Euryarchaeota archaeon]|nr:hypothetical protein [Euryarchaeota archaeon]MBT6845609.1 hypothetical protein [Euryarchaeota archaeon]